MTDQTAHNATREESRTLARAKLSDLLAVLKQMQGIDGVHALLEVGQGLQQSIDAFHLEGIRFRMFQLERLLQRIPDLPPNAVELFGQVRADLEAAGFHTRSH